MATYIDDGFTRDGYIAADKPDDGIPQEWDALEFKYRPAVRSAIKGHDADVARATGADVLGICRDADGARQGEELACKFIEKHLVAWNLKDRGKHEIKPVARAIGRLHPRLFEVLYLIIRGERRSDPRPKVETNEEADGAIESATENEATSATEGDALKNSGQG